VARYGIAAITPGIQAALQLAVEKRYGEESGVVVTIVE